jgi:dTMP kinase
MTDARASRGAFITFEGGDGAGKSTQIKRLAAALRAVRRTVVETREPGGSAGAEEIRALLVHGRADKWSPLTEALLMYAARADHLERVVTPAIARGEIVLSDRFADSSMAYQGHAGALGADAIRTLDALVVAGRKPDLTFILDVPVEAGLKRAHARGDDGRFEKKGRDYQESVRLAFLAIAKAEPERCAVVDAALPEQRVADIILAETRRRLAHIFP